jgi:hypothetical protein
VLSKSRCPHTGVVNYFTPADPLLSVGSVTVARVPARYVWRCYVGEEIAGVARDLPSAEASLRSAVAGGERKPSGRPTRKPTASAQPSLASSYWQKLNDAAAAAAPRARSLRIERV